MHEGVTSDKVTDLAPTWAPFRGWSVLGDPGPAGHDRTRRPGLELLDLAPTRTAPNGQLTDVANSIAMLPAAAGAIAMLPPSTYHVTVCDGLTDRHARKARRGARLVLEQLLDALPACIDDPAALMLGSPEPLERLLDVAARPLRMTVTGLELRGHAVVAALDAADDEDFADVEAARRTVLEQLASRTDLDLVTSWAPHVSLGYLADRSSADQFIEQLDGLWADVADELGATSFTCRGVATYAFDDMVTFWRAAPVSQPGDH